MLNFSGTVEPPLTTFQTGCPSSSMFTGEWKPWIVHAMMVNVWGTGGAGVVDVVARL